MARSAWRTNESSGLESKGKVAPVQLCSQHQFRSHRRFQAKQRMESESLRMKLEISSLRFELQQWQQWWTSWHATKIKAPVPQVQAVEKAVEGPELPGKEENVDGFEDFGTPDPFNQNDDDQVDTVEPNAPEQENPNDVANMVTGDGDDDVSFAQVATKKVTKKGDGFDNFGKPEPFSQKDDDQVDAGEPNAQEQEHPSDDANMVTDDGDGDVSYVQVATKKPKKDNDLDGFGTPDPFNQNDDDQVDAVEPNAPEQQNPKQSPEMAISATEATAAEAPKEENSVHPVAKIVGMLQAQTFEKVVLVPKMQPQEDEVPKSQPFKKVVPVSQVSSQEQGVPTTRAVTQQVVKQDPVPKDAAAEKIVETPQVQIMERVVPVPQVTIQEMPRQGTRVMPQAVVKQVLAPQAQTVERVAQALPLQQADNTVPVPQAHSGRRAKRRAKAEIEDILAQWQTQEVVKQVPRIQTRESIKQVPVPQVQAIEKVVEVPQVDDDTDVPETPAPEAESDMEFIPDPVNSHLFETRIRFGQVSIRDKCEYCRQCMSPAEAAWWCHRCGIPLHAEDFANCRAKHCESGEHIRKVEIQGGDLSDFRNSASSSAGASPRGGQAGHGNRRYNPSSRWQFLKCKQLKKF